MDAAIMIISTEAEKGRVFGFMTYSKLFFS